MRTLEQAIEHAEEVASDYEEMIGDYALDSEKLAKCAKNQRQIAAWLSILKKAKFEYDEAWRILTHPTPDVTSYDKDRAQVILNTFRDSLGRME